MACKGQSVLLIQNRYLVQSCTHSPKICNLCTNAIVSLCTIVSKSLPNFAWVSIGVVCAWLHWLHIFKTLRKFKRARKASGWDCTKVSQSDAPGGTPIGNPVVVPYTLPNGHLSANISPGRGWCAESGWGMTLQALGGGEFTLQLIPCQKVAPL